MAVNPQATLPITINDADPNIPGSGTTANAASIMPNLQALQTAHNSHTHTDLAAASDLSAHTQLTTSAHGGIVSLNDPRYRPLIPTTVKTSAYTAVSSDYVLVDTTSANITVTLPATAADGTRIGVKMVLQASAHTVSVVAGGSNVFDRTGGSTTLTLSLLNQAVILQYQATDSIWYVTSNDIPLAQLDTRYAPFGSTGGLAPFINATAAPYNAKADAYYVDGVATSGSTTFTSATATFTNADIGKTIVILRAGPSSHQDHHTTISAVAGDGLSCTLTNAAQRSQSSARFYISRNGDQTSAIQAAIDACSAAGGGWVWLPTGWYLVSGLVLKNRVELHGAGILATGLHLVANSNTPVIMNDVTANNSAMGVAIEGMRVDGNRQRQSNITTTLASAYTAGNSTISLTDASNFLPAGGTILIGSNRISYTSVSGNTLNGIEGGQEGTTDANALIGATVTQIKALGIYLGLNPFNAEPTIADFYDPHQRVQDVHIKNTKGDSIQAWGQSENRWVNIWSHYTDEIGFRPSFDSWLVNCTADTPGRMGYYIRYSEAKLSMCKTFYAGGIVAADGWGFWFQGPSALEEGTNVGSSIGAQDCKAGGAMFWNAQRRIVQATFSSNSTSSAGTYPAVALKGVASLNVIDFVATDRTSPNQMNSLSIDATCVSNKIRLTHGGANGVTLGTAISSSSNLSGGNDISINGMGGTVVPAFAATYTPDPYVATTHRVGNLTANITIAAPTNAHTGCLLNIILRQDATGGRTITWAGTYLNTPTSVTTANGFTTAKFIYDGTNWIGV